MKGLGSLGKASTHHLKRSKSEVTEGFYLEKGIVKFLF